MPRQPWLRFVGVAQIWQQMASLGAFVQSFELQAYHNYVEKQRTLNVLLNTAHKHKP